MSEKLTDFSLPMERMANYRGTHRLVVRKTRPVLFGCPGQFQEGRSLMGRHALTREKRPLTQSGTHGVSAFTVWRLFEMASLLRRLKSIPNRRTAQESIAPGRATIRAIDVS